MLAQSGESNIDPLRYPQTTEKMEEDDHWSRRMEMKGTAKFGEWRDSFLGNSFVNLAVLSTLTYLSLLSLFISPSPLHRIVWYIVRQCKSFIDFCVKFAAYGCERFTKALPHKGGSQRAESGAFILLLARGTYSPPPTRESTNLHLILALAHFERCIYRSLLTLWHIATANK